MWRTSRRRYDPDFKKFMDELMADGVGQAMYPEWTRENE
jgi:hypothetical protein